MSKFLKSLIRNPLIAIAVLAAAGNISNFESTPNASSAVVTPVQARLGVKGIFGSTKAEKSFSDVLKKETPQERDLRRCLVANGMDGYCQVSSDKANSLRSNLTRAGKSGWTIGMKDDPIKKVMVRVVAYLTEMKDEARQLKTQGGMPEMCRPAPDAQVTSTISGGIATHADEMAKKPALQAGQLHDVLHDAHGTSDGSGSGASSTDVSPYSSDDGEKSELSTGSAPSTGPDSDGDARPDHPRINNDLRGGPSSTGEEFRDQKETENVFEDVHDYVQRYLGNASPESRNKLRDSSVFRQRAISVIAAGLKKIVLSYQPAGRGVSKEDMDDEVLGYGFDRAVAGAVEEFVKVLFMKKVKEIQ